MHPTLFHLGPIPIRSYGFMMMVGFLLSIHLAARRARKCNADEEFVLQDPILVGLAVTAHETGSLSTGTFSNVTLTAEEPGAASSAESWELYR